MRTMFIYIRGTPTFFFFLTSLPKKYWTPQRVTINVHYHLWKLTVFGIKTEIQKSIPVRLEI